MHFHKFMAGKNQRNENHIYQYQGRGSLHVSQTIINQ